MEIYKLLSIVLRNQIFFEKFEWLGLNFLYLASFLIQFNKISMDDFLHFELKVLSPRSLSFGVGVVFCLLTTNYFLIHPFSCFRDFGNVN